MLPDIFASIFVFLGGVALLMVSFVMFAGTCYSRDDKPNLSLIFIYISIGIIITGLGLIGWDGLKFLGLI